MSDLVENPEERFSHNGACIISEISRLKLDPVADQTGLCLNDLEKRRQVFS